MKSFRLDRESVSDFIESWPVLVASVALCVGAVVPNPSVESGDAVVSGADDVDETEGATDGTIKLMVVVVAWRLAPKPTPKPTMSETARATTAITAVAPRSGGDVLDSGRRRKRIA